MRFDLEFAHHWRGKKEEKETGQKYNVRICYA